MVSLLVESWVWFAICMLVAIGRYYSRYETLKSIRSFCADDWLMLVVLCFFLTLIVTINIVADSSSNLLPRGFDPDTLTDSDISERRFGSKLVLVVEQCQCVVIWGVKTCLVIMYLRLTSLRLENIAIRVLAAYIGLSFAIMEILYLGVWCRPFSNYWAVPTPNPQCNAATNHLITNAVFNISSDCIMLAIALPMFLKLKITWDKKAPIVMIFSLGIFVIIASVLNKVYSFTKPFGADWTHWYVRESATSMLVCNLPFCWIYVRKTYKLLSIPFTESTATMDNGGSVVSRSVNRLARKKAPVADPVDYTLGRTPTNFTTNDIEMGLRNNHISNNGPADGPVSMNDFLGEEVESANIPDNKVTEVTHPRLYADRQRQRAAEAAKPHSKTEAEAIAADDERMRRSGVMDDTNAYQMRRGSSVPESALGSSTSASRRTSTSWV